MPSTNIEFKQFIKTAYNYFYIIGKSTVENRHHSCQYYEVKSMFNYIYLRYAIANEMSSLYVYVLSITCVQVSKNSEIIFKILFNKKIYKNEHLRINIYREINMKCH